MAIMPWQQIEGTTGSSLCMSRSGLPVYYILCVLALVCYILITCVYIYITVS